VPRYVALLKGVNVGGKHALGMAALKTVFEAHRYSDVRTLIQSGNVIFSSSKAPAAPALERMLEQWCGFSVPVVVRSATEMANVITESPLTELDSSKLHVGFMGERPSAAAIAACDPAEFLPETFAFVGSNVYLYLPHGMARTKLPSYLDRRIEGPMTVRNWNTVNALVRASGA
jgi:uncharacterized protein (DUF1697 family)